MDKPIGGILFMISVWAFAFTFVFGWVVLIVVALLQWMFPKHEHKLDSFLKRIMDPLGKLQKYSLWALGVLFVIRILAGWLGWAEPLEP